MSAKEPTVKILTDDIELEPTGDFRKLSDTIVSFVKGSDPKFSVGIYGSWGTGKTTLMKLVQKKLHKGDGKKTGKILTIWFNAWRYEREEHYATIALMKTIAFGMMEHERYRSLTQTIWNGLKIVGKDWFKQFVTGTLVTDEGWKKLETELTEKMRLLSSMERETIYFDGIKRLEDEFEQIRQEDPDSRIVIFIDDLDRCSPKRVLEVLESIKIFLDIRGFVFIIGLSDQTVVKLISKEYEESGVKGEDYIQKIIQLPIRIPPWNSNDIEKMLEEQIAGKLDENYSKFMVSNKKLISIAVQPNPRDLKRFINNVIVALETYSNLRNKKDGITDDGLLIAEALKARWFHFYLDLISNEFFRRELKDALKAPVVMRDYISHLKETKKEDAMTDAEKKLLGISDDLANFITIEKVKDVILTIGDWEIYRRATATTDSTIQFQLNTDRMLRIIAESRLLNKTMVDRFLEYMRKNVAVGDVLTEERIDEELRRFRSQYYKKSTSTDKTREELIITKRNLESQIPQLRKKADEAERSRNFVARKIARLEEENKYHQKDDEIRSLKEKLRLIQATVDELNSDLAILARHKREIAKELEEESNVDST